MKQNPFGKIRSFIWPIYPSEQRVFIPMFALYTLIVFNYSILRNAKDALILTAPSSGAMALPFIKIWGILPMALLFTYLFSVLVRKMTREKVFYTMIGIFLGFFFLFTFVLYPLRDFIHPQQLADTLQTHLPSGLQGFVAIFRNWSFTLFYVMAELWGTFIMIVLFWGFVNDITTIKKGKRFYAILGLGANIATIFSGQVSCLLCNTFLKIPFLSSNSPEERLLMSITISVLVVGLVSIILFHHLQKQFPKAEIPKKWAKKKQRSSLLSHFSVLGKSRYVLCIALIVLMYNVSLNIIELVWKNEVNALFPSFVDQTAFHSKFQTLQGMLSTVIALFLCGNIMKTYGWTVTALITPFILLITGGLFFFFVMFKNSSAPGTVITFLGITPAALAVLIGGIQNCLTRSCKFTFFDATKELAFVPLDSELRLQAKAAIDGVGSRLGKSGGSLIHELLLLCFGSISVITPLLGIILIAVTGTWILSAKSLGDRFKKIEEEGTPEPSKHPQNQEVLSQ